MPSRSLAIDATPVIFSTDPIIRVCETLTNAVLDRTRRLLLMCQLTKHAVACRAFLCGKTSERQWVLPENVFMRNKYKAVKLVVRGKLFPALLV